MKNIIFAVVSLLLAFVYFLHALRCINSHNGTDDWIRIETVRNRIFFSGTCCRISGLDFICFPVIALAYCGICILTVSPDILMLSLTAAVSAGVYLSAKLISGRKAASAAAQVLFLYELFPHFDTFFSSVPFIAFVLTSALIYIYISRPYEKMFTSALPLLFLSGFISGFGCIAYCLPAIIFLYIFSCVLKFRSDSEEYNPIHRGRAVILGL